MNKFSTIAVLAVPFLSGTSYAAQPLSMHCTSHGGSQYTVSYDGRALFLQGDGDAPHGYAVTETKNDRKAGMLYLKAHNDEPGNVYVAMNYGDEKGGGIRVVTGNSDDSNDCSSATKQALFHKMGAKASQEGTTDEMEGTPATAEPTQMREPKAKEAASPPSATSSRARADSSIAAYKEAVDGYVTLSNKAAALDAASQKVQIKSKLTGVNVARTPELQAAYDEKDIAEAKMNAAEAVMNAAIADLGGK